MKKSKNIKKFFSALCVSLLSVPMLVSCFDNNKLPDRPHENENLNDDDVHKIYNDAVRHGFNGSFENWKNTIVGEKGDSGFSFKSVTFKERNGNQDIYTVEGINGEIFEINVDISQINGKPGLQGDKGPDGQNGLQGLSTYEQYVEQYHYVGSKEDFFKDFTTHHLGFKENYTLNCYLWDGESSFNNDTFEPVFENKVFKNGEKVNFELPDLGSTYRIFAALDNVDYSKNGTMNPLIESPDLDHLIDYKDYRAYCDTNIYLVKFETPLIIEKNVGLVKDGIKLNFARAIDPYVDFNNPNQATRLDDKEYNSLIGNITWKENGMILSYDKNTHILSSNIPGKCNLKVKHKNEVFDFELEFKDKYDEVVYPELHAGIINYLSCLEVGKLVKIEYEENSNSHISPYIKVIGDNVEVYNNNFLYPVKPGSCILQLTDYESNVLSSYDVTVYEKGKAPAYEKIKELEVTYHETIVNENGWLNIHTPHYYEDNYSVLILDENHNPVSNTKYDIAKNENRYNLTFKEPGTYIIRVESDIIYGEKKVNIKE